jgi:hypothetical protein
MLKQVLTTMAQGHMHSHADLARQLDVSEGLLTQMMEDLARKGYLAALATPSDCGGCRSACGSGACSGCGATASTLVSGWTLTAKGHEAAKRHQR